MNSELHNLTVITTLLHFRNENEVQKSVHQHIIRINNLENDIFECKQFKVL